MEDLHLSSNNFGGVVPAALAASPALTHILASRFQPVHWGIPDRVQPGEGERVVTGLSLAGMNLTRTIPAAVGDLKNLTWLDLSYNNLSGAFPAWSRALCSGSLTSPTTPSTTAPLPRDIGSLSPAMEHLNLSSNSFSGGVPSAVAALPALRSLILHTNLFTGVYPAEAISNLSRLESLTLAYNVFALAPVPVAFAPG
uniref:Leucine-rich repeat-containing N-terminal plant-type domain-containing protein n=1 Tax=Oryza glumipatula TaxID=40148 RepID=A0A0E0AAW0_9ORYZ